MLEAHCRAPKHASAGVAAAFAAKLHPSQLTKFCRLKSVLSTNSRQPKKSDAASVASSAPINAHLMQVMRTRMISAFISSESDYKTPQDPPLAAAPSVDRVLLHRATLNARKLHLLSQAPAAQCCQVHGSPRICYHNILVSRRRFTFLFS